MNKKAVIISVSVLLFGLSWMAYNFFIANPIHDQKMKAYDTAIANCDQKSKLLDQAQIALDKGDDSTAHQLEYQADSIQGC
jgi:hypothetical protein